MATKWKRVTVRMEDEQGGVQEFAFPEGDDETVLQAELHVDIPTVLAGATENGVQKRKQGPVTFAQLSVVLLHRPQG